MTQGLDLLGIHINTDYTKSTISRCRCDASPQFTQAADRDTLDNALHASIILQHRINPRGEFSPKSRVSMEKFNLSLWVPFDSLNTGIALRELGSLGFNNKWKFFIRNLNLCSGQVDEEMVLVRHLVQRIEAAQMRSFVRWLSIVRIGRGELKRGKLGLRS